MKLKDVPIGATVHICSMFFVGDLKVIEQKEGSAKCVQINGAPAEETEYLRRGELPPKSNRVYYLCELVRCKDCKHRIVNEHYGEEGYTELKAMCELDTGDAFQLGRHAEDDEWFCADAERK